MTIGYLMNSYPMTSTTFVRREIQAHEAAGETVRRYAIRTWDQPLVDPRDIKERARTIYLLTGDRGRLIGSVAAEILTNPLRAAYALGALAGLCRRGGGVVRHAAYFAEACYLKRCALADGVRHIHAHFSTNSAAVAMLARRLGGPGYSFTAHGPDEFDDVEANGLKPKAEAARFVAAISRYCEGVVRAAAPAAKIGVVRCGVELSDFDPATAAPFAGNRTFACIGRLCPQKAQTAFVEAVARLKPDYPDIRVILVGDGETRAEIEAGIADRGLEGNLILHGWGANEEVRSVLASARALVLPSLAEGLPVVIMEALALGRPVVTTRITGIPELVDEDCGWIVPPGDVDALTAAMRAALEASPEALAALGAEGRRRVEARHDQAKTAADLRAMIDRYA